ncbi:hypothetical protein C8J56DRAFT_1057928 [Mycena floridula]|nr:hypothetical protein C8J56DRAFT_1057928 [Mycena floridula]
MNIQITSVEALSEAAHTLEQVLASIYTLNRVVMDLSSHNVLMYIIERWTSLSDWLTYIVKRFVEDGPLANEQTKLAPEIPDLFAGLSRQKQLPKLSSLPGFITMTIRIWLHNVHTASVPQSICDAVCYVAPRIHQNDEFTLCMPDAAILVLLTEIQNASKLKTGEISRLRTPLALLMHISREEESKSPLMTRLNLRLISFGSIPIVVGVIGRFVSSHPPPLAEFDRKMTVDCSAFYLANVLLTCGPHAVFQALDSRLLRIMSKTLPLLDFHPETTIESYVNILKSILVHQLHHIVLREMRKWLKDDRAERTIQHLLALSRDDPVFNALHATWNHVHTTFKEALDLRRMYKQDMARHDCQNPQCSTSIALRDVKVCRGCLVTYYSSVCFIFAPRRTTKRQADLASITDPGPCPVVCIFSYMTEERKKSVIPGHEFMAIPIHNIWDEEVRALLKTEKNGALCYAVLADAEESYFSVYEWVAT